MILFGTFQVYILHFLLFKRPPKVAKKSSNTFLNLLAIILEAPPIRRVSSAKIEWLISLIPQAILIPIISLLII